MDNASIPPSTPPPFSPGPAPVPPVTISDARVRQWAMWCHLSSLAGFFVPFGNVLGPLIVWQMKRGEMPALDVHGKEALNFQISALIYLLGGGVACVVGLFCLAWIVVIPVLAVIHFGALVLAVIAGIKANEGIAYRYPLTLRLIK